MQKIADQIKLCDIEKTHMPLGYKKINLKKIPPVRIEKKLMLYNEKYAFHTMMVSVANKPVSKILK